jgi:hypothetical protein
VHKFLDKLIILVKFPETAGFGFGIRALGSEKGAYLVEIIVDVFNEIFVCVTHFLAFGFVKFALSNYFLHNFGF